MMTLQYAMKLLDLKELPEGITPQFFLDATERLVERHGEAWFKEYRHWLLLSLEYVASL